MKTKNTATEIPEYIKIIDEIKQKIKK